MIPCVQDYLKQYQEVAFLQEEKKETWQKWEEKCPSLLRGWFELSHLSQQDRLEFLEDYWTKTLPYAPPIHEKIHQFFQKLEDVQIFLIKKRDKDFFDPICLYPLNNGNLFIGEAPYTPHEIEAITAQLKMILPEDYLSFFRIHRKFIKKKQVALFPLEEVRIYHQRILEDVQKREQKITFENKLVDPRNLIPFACNEEENCFQCFFKGWYPSDQIGNISFDLLTGTLSGIDSKNSYSSFLKWFSNILNLP
ncbi:MAG: hypothetical protein Tsb0015_00120 [Simkaniaceae bacterium]